MDVWEVPCSSCSSLDRDFLMDVGPMQRKRNCGHVANSNCCSALRELNRISDDTYWDDTVSVSLPSTTDLWRVWFDAASNCVRLPAASCGIAPADAGPHSLEASFKAAAVD